ncbi:MAG: chemotaxis protein CheD [Desulfuromonadales bacterium]
MNERVGIAELRIGRAPEVLKAYGLGSCLAIALYDPGLCIGGLVHCLLPQRRRGDPLSDVGKYVDAAICLMVEELTRAGADPARLQARIAGGANMFETEYLTLMHSIGVRNARCARETLQELGIPLAGEDVGGNRGRTAVFELATGRMLVYSAKDDRTITL